MKDKIIRKKIKLVIIAIIICVIIISGIVISLYKLQKQKTEQNEIPTKLLEQNVNNQISSEEITDNPEDYENLSYIKEGYNILKYETSRRFYSTIETLTNNYINYIAYNNTEVLKDIISNEYKKQYGINNNFSNITAIPKASNRQQYKNIITEMLNSQIDDNVYIFFIKGKGRVIEINQQYEFYIMLQMDTNNKTYSIYPQQYIIDKAYNKLKVGDRINIKLEDIKRNTSNQFEFTSKTDLEMANVYFDNFKELIQYYNQDAYNQLNSEYSKKRFGNISKFNSYLKDANIVENMVINQYSVKSYRNYTDYICTDQYNNYYIFRQQGGIMRYSVFLDSYTVELDTFKENYEKADENTKVAIQVGKFKQMLNTKDYNAIFNKLNTVFRNNNFNTVSKLENYLKSKVYDINTIEIEDCNQNNDYYVCGCVLTNQKNTKEQKKMTIIIKLIDSNNFEMSFNINE